MNKQRKTFGAVLVLLLCLLLAASALADDDHRYGSWVVKRAATCSQEGHEFRYCRDCDHWEQRYTKKLPHTVESWEITKEPTCREDGVRVATCTVCGAFLRVVIDKLGHDWQVTNTIIAPTCNSSGKGDYICARCGKTKTDSIPHLSHQFGEWTVISEPKGKRMGMREHTCLLCGKVEKKQFYYEGTLYEGMDANDEVIRLQVMLRDLGYYTGKISSGKYGEMTGKAVSKFQKANGIKESAVADPNTLAAIRQAWFAKTGRDPVSITLEDAAQ